MIQLNTRKVHWYISANKNLSDFYRYYISHCTSLTLPYHNINHTLGMMQHVITIYEAVNKGGKSSVYGFRLDDQDLFMLLTAAMFHDFNHSGGRFDDSVNIENAINGLFSCIDACLIENEDSIRLKEACAELIKATQFPYVIPDEMLDIRQRILRECDITVCFYEDYISHTIFGLAEEMKQKDMIAFFAGQVTFINDSVKSLRLVYSRELAEAHLDSLYKEIDALSKIIIKNDAQQD